MADKKCKFPVMIKDGFPVGNRHNHAVEYQSQDHDWIKKNDVIWQCTTCGFCTFINPFGKNPFDKTAVFYRISDGRMKDNAG